MSIFDGDVYKDLFAAIAATKEQRDAFVAELETGSVTLSGVFDRARQDPVLESMKVLRAIEALPETGKVSTRRAFGDLGISEAGLIRDVTDAQIEALPKAIESHAR